MADKSAIEWTDATWNPVTGCDRVSPGCAHCYALTLAGRLKRMGNPRYQVDGDPKSSGPGFGVTLHKDVLGKPLRWRRPRMVFVNSMSDLFHEAVPASYIAQVFAVMAFTPEHTYQVLTKRPERMLDLLGREGEGFPGFWQEELMHWGIEVDWPLPNVWLGVSIENRRFVHRADLLRQTPAAVRFISAEPLLGPLVGGEAHGAPGEPHADGRVGSGRAAATAAGPNPVSGQARAHAPLDLTDIDWLIVGGESGPGHRRIDPQWVRDLRERCLEQIIVSECACPPFGHCQHRTQFFFKQWGGPTSKSGGRELDGRTWDEMPATSSGAAGA
jgi:protein gp37